MKVLELFCGSKSFTRICEEHRHECITVDIEDKFNPTYVMDILNPKLLNLLEKNKFDLIWASPPCTEYSRAKSQGVRNIRYANSLVRATINLFNRLKPKFWILENPQTGLLKYQPMMKDIPFTDVSYCKYGLPYRKHTRLWNNFDFKGIICNNDCDFLVDGLIRKRHLGSAGCGGKGQGHKISYSNRSYTQFEKYEIPKLLCLEILTQIEDREKAK